MRWSQGSSSSATGVDYVVRGASHSARAMRETILAAGGIGSPQLLQLSGIGPVDVLRAADVEIVHDLPGVGENLQDHLHYRSRWEVNAPLTPFGRRAAETAAIEERYAAEKGAPLATNHFESGAFLSSSTAVASPDIELLMIPYLINPGAPELRPPDRHGFTISGFATRPCSRGRVTIVANDPLDRPAIDPCYLSDPDDLRLMRDIIRRSREIAAQPAFAAVRGAEFSPGEHNATDDALIADIRAHASTSFHPVGSCKMGTDAMAVVDPELRVHGLYGLRIADASVTPTLITGHPNAPTIMIAEKAAELCASARS